MQTGKYDVVPFAAQARARLQHHEIALSRDDTEFWHTCFRQSAHEAAVMINKLRDRGAKSSQERRQPPGHM